MGKISMKERSNHLIEEILKIQGKKIVILIVDDADIFKLDISKDNEFGYAPEHKILFKEKLNKALQKGGGLIICQFLSIRTQRMTENGKEMWVPEKNLYGAILGNNDWIGMDIQSLKKAFETDATTELPLAREENTHYRNFPIK